MKKCGVYAIKHIASGKAYIGSSSDIVYRRRVHLSMMRRGVHHATPLRHACTKYGGEAFVFVILEQVQDQKNLDEREQFWIDAVGAYGRRGYNVVPQAGSPRGRKLSPEHIEKLRIASTGRKHTPETIALLRSVLIGIKKQPRRDLDAHSAAMSLRHKGKVTSEETKKKMSLAQKGRKVSEEARAKLKRANTGKTMSEETREKISKSNIGRPVSEETRSKLRISCTGKKHGPCPEHVKRAVSLAHKGKIVSSETREKMRVSMIAAMERERLAGGRKISEETRKKIRAAGLGRKHSEEAKSKMRAKAFLREATRRARQEGTLSEMMQQNGVGYMMRRDKIISAGGMALALVLASPAASHAGGMPVVDVAANATAMQQLVADMQGVYDRAASYAIQVKDFGLQVEEYANAITNTISLPLQAIDRVTSIYTRTQALATQVTAIAGPGGSIMQRVGMLRSVASGASNLPAGTVRSTEWFAQQVQAQLADDSRLLGIEEERRQLADAMTGTAQTNSATALGRLQAMQAQSQATAATAVQLQAVNAQLAAVHDYQVEKDALELARDQMSLEWTQGTPLTPLGSEARY